jgi:hypothetical protein
MTTSEPFDPDNDPSDPRNGNDFPEGEIIDPSRFFGFINTDAIREEVLRLEDDSADPDDTFGEMVALLSYMPELLAEIDRLYTLMRAERLRYANLRAACLAAFSADADREADPLSYIRDEFTANSTIHDVHRDGPGKHRGRP